MIKLQSINLYSSSYGTDKGKLTGSVKFATNFGEISISPSLETQAKIIEIMGDEIVNATKEAAADMQTAVNEAIERQRAPAIEHDKNAGAQDADFDEIEECPF